MNSAMLCPHRIPSQRLNTQRGGNLARVFHASSTQEGHSLFIETGSRPAVPTAASAPEAPPHGLLPPRVPPARHSRHVVHASSYALVGGFGPSALSAISLAETPYTE